MRDLHRLGVSPGDSLLAHTSLSRIGHVEGGASTVVQALIDAVGPEGTVLFPSHSGSAEVSPDHPPVFDLLKMPCVRWVGVIPETARRRPDGVRSLHPTHSVTAFGRLASWFVEGHERCETPCGAGTPYVKLAEVHGKILLVGCDHESNTSLHGVEEVAALPYHLLPGAGPAELTDALGQVQRVPMRYHRWGVERDFMRIDGELMRRAIQNVGKVGLAESRLVDADKMWRFVLERVQADPGALLPEGYAVPEL